MAKELISEDILTTGTSNKRPDQIIMDYAAYLDSFGFNIGTDDYFLVAGEIPAQTSWIVHLSIVLPQIPEILEKLIPLLRETNISFSMPKDFSNATFVHYGHLGYLDFGKIITLYPKGDEQTVSLVKSLQKLTTFALGPSIPTAAPLGGIVYTQYVNPIPFKPEMWPFGIKMPLPKGEHKKIFWGKYMIQEVLKHDVKGNVFRGIYLKGFLKIANCVIKQGRPYMWYDNERRDIRDRLKWQKETLTDLQGIVNVPKVIDLISDDEHIYLVMDFIKGQHFEKFVKDIYNECCYKDLSKDKQHTLIKYLIRIVDVVQILHINGYVHRDITPANFMLDKNDRIFLIDLELAYSKHKKYPQKPFGIGTDGFMSQQQFERQPPTEAEDIYATGGMIIYFLTGIAPYKFEFRDQKKLSNELTGQIEDQQIINIIANCYRQEPGERPSLKIIKDVLQRYEQTLLNIHNLNIYL